MAKPASKGASAAKQRPRPAPAMPTSRCTRCRKRTRASPRYAANDEELLKFYEQMLLIRRFEEKAGQLYGLGLIGGFCHLYIGQEAVAVGLQSALDRAARTASSPATATTATCSPTASIPRSSWPS